MCAGGPGDDGSTTAGANGEIRVLHVDDDASFGQLVSEFLERERGVIEVVTACGADEGLRTLRNEPIDCVVSDFDMPGTDGLELLEAVRERDPDLPFVLFTGKGSEEIASEAISAGVTDYLQKGTGTDQYALLANRVVNAVRQYRAERRSEEHRRRLEVRSAAMEASIDGMAILDDDGRYRYVNRAHTEIYGYDDPEAFVGESWRMCYSEAELERLDDEVLPTLMSEGSWRGSATGRRQDGSTFPQELSLSVTERGDIICVVRDVSG